MKTLTEITTRSQEIDARMAEIVAASEAAEGDALDGLHAEMKTLTEERKQLGEDAEKRNQLLKDIAGGAAKGLEFKPEGKENRDMEIKDKNLQYREAFKAFVMRGTPIPVELRLDDTATTTDLAAVIPASIGDKIVESLVSYGKLWALVAKSNLKGGVAYPVSSVKPVATWTSEGSVSDKQSMTLTGKVTFTYFKLQCRVALTLEADTVSLSGFESFIANNVTRAMIVAIETAILAGNGTTEPKGLTTESIAAGRVASLTSTSIKKFETWAAVVAKVPQSYRQGAILVLTQADWDTYIVGMVDADGQPVARTTVGIDGYPQERLLGFPVILIESGVDTFADAANTDVIGAIFRPADYVVNSNLQMTMKRYFWEETDEWITKATLIADGKMIDTAGLVLIKASK